MIKINFWGDFKATSVEGLHLSSEVFDLIRSAKINVVNFEAPVEPQYLSHRISKSGPSHYQDPSGPKWLEQKGFNLISLANNHSMDYGAEALEQTIKSFETAKTFGAGNWENAYSPCFYDCDGTIIAVLGLSHYEFGMLADKWDNRYGIGVAWINHPSVDSIILETKKHCNYLIVFAHAGIEHVEQPLPEWRDRYRSFIELGCDAVIASHPHIAQGWETYMGKPIVYSLGNFYFPKPKKMSAQWYLSLCATLTLQDEEISLQITPISFSSKEIRLDISRESNDYLKDVNNVLSDNQQYLRYINDCCLAKLRAYDTMFSSSGYINCVDWKQSVKRIISLIKRRSCSVHVENILRCESHRWCIARGLKIRDQYQ